MSSVAKEDLSLRLSEDMLGNEERRLDEFDFDSLPNEELLSPRFDIIQGNFLIARQERFVTTSF